MLSEETPSSVDIDLEGIVSGGLSGRPVRFWVVALKGCFSDVINELVVGGNKLGREVPVDGCVENLGGGFDGADDTLNSFWTIEFPEDGFCLPNLFGRDSSGSVDGDIGDAEVGLAGEGGIDNTEEPEFVPEVEAFGSEFDERDAEEFDEFAGK